LTAVFGGLSIAFTSLGLGVAIAVVTALKRHRAQKKAQDRYAI
jgi:hypothetical protein